MTELETEYFALVRLLSEQLGGKRALARQIGKNHSTIQHREAKPSRVSLEALYALRYLDDKINR